MRGQLERLLELTGQPNIAIQVVPFAAGPHPGMEGAFTILTLPDLAHDVVYVEGPAGSIYLEEQDDVRRCTMHFACSARWRCPRRSPPISSLLRWRSTSD